MRPYRALAAALGSATLAGPAAAAGAAPSTDAQIWSELDLVAPVGPAQVTLLGVVRNGDRVPDPTLAGGGVLVDSPAWRGFTLTGGVLAVEARLPPPADIHLEVTVPLVAVSYGWRWGGFAFSERSRAEPLLGVPGDPWRFRQRLAVEHPLRLGPVRSAFASEEGFYDVDSGRWTRSRAQLGLGLAPAGPLRVQLYWLRQDDRTAVPGAINALGVTVAVRL